MAPSSSTLPWKYRLVEPHVAFWLLCLAFKLLVPSVIKFFAYDTISTTILSVWYPVCATITLIHRESQPSATPDRLENNSNAATQAARERKFWIEYWVAGYSLAQFVHQAVLSVPVILRWSFQYSFLPQVMAEVKFVFFVWIFAMEPALREYQRFLALDKKEAGHYKDFVPLTLIKRAIRPRLLDLQSVISDPISKENWTRFIHSKAHKVLNLLVALQFLSEEWCEHLLHLLDECRSLLLLAPFLILPSPITRVGILYAQHLLPSARSLLARGRIIEVLYLQYWVLNIFFATGVSLGSWLWWFVPFSTQIIFAIWCYLTFPQTITQYYAVVETELIAFGVLSGEVQLPLEETKTVQALRAVAKRIPSASDAEGFQWADSDSVDGRYGSRSKRKLVPRANSAPATLLAISAMKAMHDSAMHDSASGMLSPQHEMDEEDSDTEPEKSTVMKKRPKSFSVRDRSFGSSSRSLSVSTRRDSEDDDLQANVSMIVEDDEASQDSTKAMVNIDLSSDNNNQVYDEVEITMKELSAAKLRASKSTAKAKSPQAYEERHSNPKPYHSPLRSSIMRQMSDEQKPRPRKSSLVSPASISRRSASYTPRSNPSCGFEISDIDTTASSSAIETAESFDSNGAVQVPHAFRAASKVPPAFASASKSKSGTPKSTTKMEDIARRAARRSERIRKIQEEKEARKLNHLTESLLFMRSASTDESEAGRSIESMLSETSSSTGNRGLTGASDSSNNNNKAPSPNRMRRRRQRSSDSEISDTYNPRLSQGSDARNVSGSSISRQSSFPRYVQVDSSETETRERRARRSRSRDNMIPLDSDKVAQ